MSKSQLIFATLVAVVTIGGAYTQGKITDRWSNEVSERLAVFTSHLDGVPTEIGDWVSQEVPVPEDQFKASNCHGVVSRAYRNTTTGDDVTLFLVSGKGYHVTIHTPDWCYVAAGYEMENDPNNYSFDVPGIKKPEFLTAKFKKVTSTETTRLRVIWSYSEDGTWTAPQLAKYTFGSKPAMYKVYVISRQDNTSGRQLSDDAAVTFAKELLPVLDPILFPAKPAATPSSS